jgi:hypothetical protein
MNGSNPAWTYEDTVTFSAIKIACPLLTYVTSLFPCIIKFFALHLCPPTLEGVYDSFYKTQAYKDLSIITKYDLFMYFIYNITYNSCRG